MPSIGHIAVGMAVGEHVSPSPTERWRWIAAYVVLSCAADLDFVLVMLGVPHDSLWGHRGVSHSLAVAGLAALGFGWLARRWGQSFRRAAVLGFAIYTSHILFDCLNVGAWPGVPWFWPLTAQYFTVPWHPIPAVKTASEFLTPRGIPVLAAEILIFAPFWVYAILKGAGRRPPRRREAPEREAGGRVAPTSRSLTVR